MNPTPFKVATLKEVCTSRRIMASGTKTELIRRLQEIDPSDGWIETALIIQVSAEGDESEEGASGGLTLPPNRRPTQLQPSPAQGEIELLRRERDLMQRELELAKREVEFLRNSSPANVSMQQSSGRMSINTLKDLISDSEGNTMDCRRWKEQFQLMITTYGLDDAHGRLLMSMKGKAQKWFHSKPEYIGIPLLDLLEELGNMFDFRQNRITQRKKFKNRSWKASESFNDSFHEKLILANTASVDEEDLIDYIVGRIPNSSLRNQARIQRFVEKKDLLQAFSKISLKGKIKENQESKKTTPSSSSTAKDEGKEEKSFKKDIRCYNCSKFDHVAEECRLPVRPKEACFRCFEIGHMSNDGTNSINK